VNSTSLVNSTDNAIIRRPQSEKEAPPQGGPLKFTAEERAAQRERLAEAESRARASAPRTPAHKPTVSSKLADETEPARNGTHRKPEPAGTSEQVSSQQGDGEQVNGKPVTGEPPAEPEPDWEEPIPFGQASHVPAFPVSLLPGWMRDWVIAESEATQTPRDLSAMLALAIGGAALARKYRVQIRNGWTEPTNIYTVTALPPGDRKSAVFENAMAPVLDAERAEQERLAPVIAERAAEHRVLEGQRKAAEDQAAKGKNGADYRKLAREVAEHIVPENPRLFTDDVTPEQLVKMIAKHGGRMLVASAEGTAFEIAKGRYAETPNFDVFLKSHAGDPLRSDRVGRSDDIVNQPALSVALAVQPAVISGLAEQSSMRTRGFLARFFYAMPISLVGHRTVAAQPVPKSVTNEYHSGMRWLWEREGAVVDETGQPGPHWLKFSPEADQNLRDFEKWLEPKLGECGELSALSGLGSKLAGGIARLAGILHMARVAADNHVSPSTISKETVQAAIQIGRDYLLPHAHLAFDMMGSDQVLMDAKKAVEWLSNPVNTVVSVTGVACVSQRDMHAGLWGGNKTAEDVKKVVDRLVENGYLRHVEEPQVRRKGRKPSPRYEVNPFLFRHNEKRG